MCIFSFNRKKTRQRIQEAIHVARGKLPDHRVDDAIDMATHNEPVIALENLIWQLADAEAELTSEEYSIISECARMLELHEQDLQLLDACRIVDRPSP